MLPDMSAKVSFLSRAITADEQKPRLAASQSALVNKGKSTLVYLVQGDRVKETPVTVGIKLGDMTEITSGLKAGDRVVVKSPGGLKDGSKIKIAEK
jgi:multidrug efflux pump subunit AcrA (membrane-fusion protein)